MTEIEKFFSDIYKYSLLPLMEKNDVILKGEFNKDDFKINNIPVIDSFVFKTGYVYSETYQRVFKISGDKLREEPFSENNGDFYLYVFDAFFTEFIGLKVENTFEVLELPENFGYKEYERYISKQK